MNNATRTTARIAGTLLAVMTASMLFVGCATAPASPAGAADARNKLTRLQANPTFADLASVEIREAEAAVRLAEQPVGKDLALGEYRVYLADRKVGIAMAKAETRNAEAQRDELSQARDDARLAARTSEADKAHRQASMARNDANAERARSAEATAEAARNAEKLQKQIDELKAEATERGLVLTLGNTLFATGRSDLKQGQTASLDKLVVFLNDYPDRTVEVEGHTDDVGSLDMNQTLSMHRADAVRTYLMQHGIKSGRLTAIGLGETQPIADNLSDSGRQQNRRVEVIITNPPATAATASTT
ncbi:MAG: OmpA family protein [Woeseia sp.]